MKQSCDLMLRGASLQPEDPDPSPHAGKFSARAWDTFPSPGSRVQVHFLYLC